MLPAPTGGTEMSNTQKAMALFVIGAGAMTFYFASKVFIALAPLMNRTPSF